MAVAACAGGGARDRRRHSSREATSASSGTRRASRPANRATIQVFLWDRISHRRAAHRASPRRSTSSLAALPGVLDFGVANRSALPPSSNRLAQRVVLSRRALPRLRPARSSARSPTSRRPRTSACRDAGRDAFTDDRDPVTSSPTARRVGRDPGRRPIRVMGAQERESSASSGPARSPSSDPEPEAYVPSPARHHFVIRMPATRGLLPCGGSGRSIQQTVYHSGTLDVRRSTLRGRQLNLALAFSTLALRSTSALRVVLLARAGARHAAPTRLGGLGRAAGAQGGDLVAQARSPAPPLLVPGHRRRRAGCRRRAPRTA